MHYFPWFIKYGGLFVTGIVKNEKILKDTPNIISSSATNTTSHTKEKKKRKKYPNEEQEIVNWD